MIELTEHQSTQLDRLLSMDVPVRALRGLAGTGKTSVIPHIVRRLGDVEVTAPTNRAALILRNKGLTAAKTLFKACMRPRFDDDYTSYSLWLSNPERPLPKLLEGRDKAEIKAKLDVESASREEKDAALGINAMDHVVGWNARDRGDEGAKYVIIDESSMIDEKLLFEAQRAYEYVILVGDPGQLPPVKGTPVLREAEGVDLVDVHRQAEDSPILRYAYAVRDARSGKIPPLLPGIESAKVYDPGRGPILVYRNATRKALNIGMRNKLKYPRWELQKGEPLICKATSRKWQELGLLNNSLWTYQGGNRVVNELGEFRTVPKMYVEDMTQGDPDPTACQFYLGYAMTTHSAQGSEFDSVQIALSDVIHAQSQGDDFWRQLMYTMVTRAKNKLWVVQL